LDGTDQKPLDDGIKKQVRSAIASAKNNAIFSEALENLKKKYHVKFIGRYEVLKF
jgi:hypothetical protein